MLTVFPLSSIQPEQPASTWAWLWRSKFPSSSWSVRWTCARAPPWTGPSGSWSGSWSSRAATRCPWWCPTLTTLWRPRSSSPNLPGGYKYCKTAHCPAGCQLCLKCSFYVCARSITPIFTLSSVSGVSLDLLKVFLNILPPLSNSKEQEELMQQLTEFQVHTHTHTLSWGVSSDRSNRRCVCRWMRSTPFLKLAPWWEELCTGEILKCAHQTVDCSLFPLMSAQGEELQEPFPASLPRPLGEYDHKKNYST